MSQAKQPALVARKIQREISLSQRMNLLVMIRVLTLVTTIRVTKIKVPILAMIIRAIRNNLVIKINLLVKITRVRNSLPILMAKTAKIRTTLLNRVTRISLVMRSLIMARVVSLLIKTPLPIKMVQANQVINHPSRMARLTIMSKVV